MCGGGGGGDETIDLPVQVNIIIHTDTWVMQIVTHVSVCLFTCISILIL